MARLQQMGSGRLQAALWGTVLTNIVLSVSSQTYHLDRLPRLAAHWQPDHVTSEPYSWKCAASLCDKGTASCYSRIENARAFAMHQTESDQQVVSLWSRNDAGCVDTAEASRLSPCEQHQGLTSGACRWASKACSRSVTRAGPHRVSWKPL